MRRVLIGIIIFLVIGVLSVILTNGIQRCFINWQEQNTIITSYDIDLYLEDLNCIPSRADIGMTILYDNGIHDLKTGIYTLAANNTLVKMKVPKVGDRYNILRDKYAGFSHTIKQSYLELKQPNETLLLQGTSPSFSVLSKDVRKIIIHENIIQDLILKIAPEETIRLKFFNGSKKFKLSVEQNNQIILVVEPQQEVKKIIFI